MNRLLIIFCLLGVLGGCTPTAPASIEPETGVDLIASQMLDEVNRWRRTGCKCGSTTMPSVRDLVLNEQLTQAAKRHAKDMALNKHFNHTGTDGTTAADRVRATGYQYSFVGENIANGYPTVREVVDGWQKSEGHCKNMMNPDYKDLGVGMQNNYWVQVFGSRQ